MIRKILLATVLLAAGSVANAVPIFSENFDDISTLGASGWLLVNNSTPGGSTSWFQGNDGVFASQGGAADSYIAANYLNAGAGGNISNWLLSPEMALYNGSELTFFTRSAGTFADNLEIRVSQSGSDVGGTDGSVGDFSLLMVINPALDPSGYPSDWTAYTVSFSGLTDGALGRFAFRYVVPDTNVNGDYIGIDSVSVNVPEPGTWALFMTGLIGVALRRRSVRRTSQAARSRWGSRWTWGLGLVATAGFAVPAVAEPPAAPASNGLMTFPNVRVVNAPARQSSAPAAKSEGMRAAVDADTGRLRQLTPEEAQQLSAASKTKAKLSSGPPRRTAAVADESATSDAGQIVYGPDNAVGMTLGEEAMIYQVARKTDEGLEVQEHTGIAAADRAVSGQAQKKEVGHGR